MDRLHRELVLVIFMWAQCVAIQETTIYRDLMTSVTLPCQFDEAPSIRLWKMQSPGRAEEILFMHHNKFTNDRYYSLDTRYQSWNLVISTILERHKGVYSCMKEGMIPVQKYSLIINGPPSLPANTPWLYSVSVPEGNTAKLMCNFTGSPQPSIHWFAEENDDLRPIHVEGPILQLANITRACGTRFVCLAENKYSDSPINMTFDVEVAFPPQILLYDANSPNKDVTLTEIYRKRGVEVVLRCDVIMFPDVKLYWKIRNKNSKLQELVSYTPGGEVLKSSKGNLYNFQVKVLPQKKVTMFDLVFITDQEKTFSEYVCETEGDIYPGTHRSIAIHKLR
ncbi:igLON family member 5-like [Crassostrea virginica]